MSEYQLTVMAEQDLEDIYDHIAEQNPDAAFRVIYAIEKRSEALADMPNAGKKRDEFLNGVRSVAEGNYVIFYKKIPAVLGTTMAQILYRLCGESSQCGRFEPLHARAMTMPMAVVAASSAVGSV